MPLVDSARAPDFVIVGAGVIGLASAWALAQSGASVTLIDRGRVGQESSWAGGGILSPLMPWHYPAAVNRLVGASLALYPAWTDALQQETGIDPQFWQCGMLHLPPFDVEAAQNWCRAADWPCELQAARETVPELAEDVQALWLPAISQVRNPRLLAALQAAVTAAGVTLCENVNLTGFERAGDRLVALQTSAGPMTPGHVVITGGAWTQTLLGTLAGQIQIRPVRGQMLLYQGEPGRLSHVLYGQGTYIIPRRDGHILTGSTLEEVGFDHRVTDAARLAIADRAEAMLPWLAQLPIEQQWSGLRPGSPDNIPTIGRHPEIANLYVNSGQFRYGITLAPISARLLLDMIFERPPVLDATPYAWRP